jgi:single-strand DNA-binding protein
MINKVILLGTCGKEPETRFFSNGDQQTTISLATSQRWKDKDGEKHEKTSWHNLIFSRGLARIASEYIHKGSKIYIEGEIDYQEWEGKGGEKKYRTVIQVLEMQMLGDKNTTKRDAPADDFNDDIEF